MIVEDQILISGQAAGSTAGERPARAAAGALRAEAAPDGFVHWQHGPIESLLVEARLKPARGFPQGSRGLSRVALKTPADVAQLVEHHLAKVDVASSSLVVRSQDTVEASSRCLHGGVAERRGSGLQSRIRGFESRPHLGGKPAP